MTHTIKILDTGLDRYKLEPQEIILGRQYDHEADEIVIERPAVERDSLCVMIITDANGGYVDHISMNTNSYKIKSNVSMHRFVKIGFRFARQDDYTKNSEIAVGQFLTAQKPYDFNPSDPTQKQDIDYLLGFGFADSRLHGNELQFFNMNGDKVVAFDLSPFMQEQVDLGETDVSRETFVKGKKTSNLRNDGEDGASPYATQEWTRVNAGKIDSITVNGNPTSIDENKNVNLEVLETKGGRLTGDLAIQGNLNVAGTTTTLDTQTLLVKDNIIVTNSDKAELLNLSGLAINKNASETYGLMYDPADDTVKFGLGAVDWQGKFNFSETANAMAVRADSSLFVDGNLVKWDAKNKRFVDSGKNANNFALVNEENTFNAKQNFNSETEFNAPINTTDDINITNSVVRVFDNTEGKDMVTQYSADEIVMEDNGEQHVLTLPKKSGTIALTTDVPDVNIDNTTITKNDSGQLQAVGLKDTVSGMTLTAEQIWLACSIEREV